MPPDLRSSHGGLESLRAKGSKVRSGRRPRDEIADDLRGGRSEQNAIAEMTAGQPAAGLRRRADDRQRIAGGRAKSGPDVYHIASRNRRPQLPGEREQMVDGLRPDLAVETGAFHGGAHHNAPPPAGNQVNLRRAQNMAQGRLAAPLHRQHMPFAGLDPGAPPGLERRGKSRRVRPGSAAIDEGFRAPAPVGGGYFDPSRPARYGQRLLVLADLHPGGDGRLRQRLA